MRGYKQRSGGERKALNVQVDVQVLVDLRALASANKVTMGEVVERVVSAYIRRLEKKQVSKAAKDVDGQEISSI